MTGASARALGTMAGAGAATSLLSLRSLPAASLAAAIVFLFAAPLFTLDRRARRPGRGFAAVSTGILVFSLAAVLIGGMSFGTVAAVAGLLLVFATAALGLGLFASTVLSDEISAAFWTYLLLVALAAGPLLAGPWIPWIPAPEKGIELLLLASPLVSVSAACDLDIMRTEALYRWTPIGQWRFHYPHWLSSFAFGLALSGLFFAGSFFKKEHRT
jgi:asparagine N-glycosylation enzyme membrane subunit Stt3